MQKFVNDKAHELNRWISEGLDTSVKTVGEWLKPHEMKELMQLLSIFIVDAFAVSLWKKTASDTPEFVEWYFRWTEQLLGFWPKNEQMTGANMKIHVEVPLHNDKKG